MNNFSTKDLDCYKAIKGGLSILNNFTCCIFLNLFELIDKEFQCKSGFFLLLLFNDFFCLLDNI